MTDKTALDHSQDCYFCGHHFGLLEARYHVRISVKPPGSPNRWALIGYACEQCSYEVLDDQHQETASHGEGI